MSITTKCSISQTHIRRNIVCHFPVHTDGNKNAIRCFFSSTCHRLIFHGSLHTRYSFFVLLKIMLMKQHVCESKSLMITRSISSSADDALTKNWKNLLLIFTRLVTWGANLAKNLKFLRHQTIHTKQHLGSKSYKQRLVFDQETRTATQWWSNYGKKKSRLLVCEWFVSKQWEEHSKLGDHFEALQKTFQMRPCWMF